MNGRTRWEFGARRAAQHGSSAIPERVSVFVTVGTELPFERLIQAVDSWAQGTGRGGEVFAQIGHTEYRPANIAWAATLDGGEFRRLFSAADLIVAHAGMGTILAALQQGRPLVVVPRRAALGEHRNDHQLSTARHLRERGLVRVVDDEADLPGILDGSLLSAEPSAPAIGEFAEPSLIAAVRDGLR